MDKSCCNIKNIPQTISKTTNMQLAVLHYHALKECLLYTGNMSLHRYRGGLKAHPRPPSHSWRIPELLERGACSTQPLEPDVMNAEVIPGAWGRQSSLGWVQKVTDYCLPIFSSPVPSPPKKFCIPDVPGQTQKPTLPGLGGMEGAREGGLHRSFT